MPFLVLRNRKFVRVEAIASKEGKVPFGQIIHTFLHESNLFFRDNHVGHITQLLVQQLGKSHWIDSFIAVEECIFHLSARIGLQYVVLTTERISVVIGEMLNYLSHIYS